MLRSFFLTFVAIAAFYSIAQAEEFSSATNLTTQFSIPVPSKNAVIKKGSGWAAFTGRTDGLENSKEHYNQISGGTNCTPCGDRFLCGAIGSDRGLFGVSFNRTNFSMSNGGEAKSVFKHCVDQTFKVLEKGNNSSTVSTLSVDEKKVFDSFKELEKQKIIRQTGGVEQITFDYQQLALNDKFKNLPVYPVLNEEHFLEIALKGIDEDSSGYKEKKAQAKKEYREGYLRDLTAGKPYGYLAQIYPDIIQVKATSVSTAVTDGLPTARTMEPIKDLTPQKVKQTPEELKICNDDTTEWKSWKIKKFCDCEEDVAQLLKKQCTNKFHESKDCFATLKNAAAISKSDIGYKNAQKTYLNLAKYNELKENERTKKEKAGGKLSLVNFCQFAKDNNDNPTELAKYGLDKNPILRMGLVKVAESWKKSEAMKTRDCDKGMTQLIAAANAKEAQLKKLSEEKLSSAGFKDSAEAISGLLADKSKYDKNSKTCVKKRGAIPSATKEDSSR